MHGFFSLCDHLWHRTPISEAEIQISLQVHGQMDKYLRASSRYWVLLIWLFRYYFFCLCVCTQRALIIVYWLHVS